MIGICYFADKNNEYMAESQVNAIVNNEEDQAILFKEDSDFSGEGLDSLIEAAAQKKCSKLVVLTEENQYNRLSQIIPQIYGDMFNEVEIIAENFLRIKEATPQAVQPAAAPAAATKAPAAPEVPEFDPRNSQKAQIGPSFFLCDAVHLSKKSLTDYITDVNTFSRKYGIPTDKIRRSFTTVDSARLEGAAMREIANAFPKKIANFEEVVKNMTGDSPDFSLETDMFFTLEAFFQKAAIKKEQVKDQNGQVVEKEVQDQSAGAINIFAPAKQFEVLYKAYTSDPRCQKFRNTISIFKMPSRENKENEKISGYFEELLNTDKALEKDTSLMEDWVAAQKEGKNNIDIQTINYIRTIMRMMLEYQKLDKKRPHDKAKRESELIKALKEIARRVSGFDNAVADVSRAEFIKAGIDAAKKIYGAVKKDLENAGKDDASKLFDESKTKDRNPVNIFTWKKYRELRKLLIGQ